MSGFASTGRLAKHAFRVEVEPVRVDADPARIEQIVSNLVENAVKYTPEGGSIEVVVSHDGDHAVLRVRGSGIGIPADALPKIFELFSRGEAAQRSGEGLGIGLAVVRSLVDLHGGTVEAASDGPGYGSIFTVHLPSTNSFDEGLSVWLSGAPCELISPVISRPGALVDGAKTMTWQQNFIATPHPLHKSLALLNSAIPPTPLAGSLATVSGGRRGIP